MVVSLTCLPDTLGHPFGKVPSPKPFDASSEEAQVILSDPANPVGKEVLCGKYMYWYNVHSSTVIRLLHKLAAER